MSVWKSSQRYRLLHWPKCQCKCRRQVHGPAQQARDSRQPTDCWSPESLERFCKMGRPRCHVPRRLHLGRLAPGFGRPCGIDHGWHRPLNGAEMSPVHGQETYRSGLRCQDRSAEAGAACSVPAPLRSPPCLLLVPGDGSGDALLNLLRLGGLGQEERWKKWVLIILVAGSQTSSHWKRENDCTLYYGRSRYRND